MVRPQDLTSVSTFSIEIEDEEEKHLKVAQFFRNNQDAITKELFKIGVLITDRGNVKKYSQLNKSVLTLPPTIISLSVKDNFVNITVFK